MEKHSKSPWKWATRNGEYLELYDAKGNPILYPECDDGGYPAGYTSLYLNEADALVIRLAPMLLEALKELVKGVAPSARKFVIPGYDESWDVLFDEEGEA